MKNIYIRYILSVSGLLSVVLLTQCLTMGAVCAKSGNPQSIRKVNFHFSPRDVKLGGIIELFSVNQIEMKVRGTVTDTNGEPLPGVTVSVPGTTIGTATGLDGKYTLSVPEGSTLAFSFVGFETQQVVVGNQAVIDITLVEDLASLDEVVVVGYGTQRKSDLTGSISSISSQELRQTPAGNFLEQSQGRLAGVDIVRANGSPGAPVQIRIRGNRSINASNEPLYVIDGIPTTANINDFNPNDIASMEVLKDASAVAIYGSRGANGVVLITTKRGKTGKAVISYEGYYGVKRPVENIDLMDGRQFAEYARVARGHAADDPSFDSNFLSSLEISNLQSGNLQIGWIWQYRREASKTIRSA